MDYNRWALVHFTWFQVILQDYNQEPLPKPYLGEEPEEVLVPKGYSAIILDEYVIDANFTLEHCGCQRYLKGIVIPFVEMHVFLQKNDTVGL